jgi:hypothetical protein
VAALQARHAGVAEQVDARVSKTRFFGSAGSTPAARTTGFNSSLLITTR